MCRLLWNNRSMFWQQPEIYLIVLIMHEQSHVTVAAPAVSFTLFCSTVRTTCKLCKHGKHCLPSIRQQRHVHAWCMWLAVQACECTLWQPYVWVLVKLLMTACQNWAVTFSNYRDAAQHQASPQYVCVKRLRDVWNHVIAERKQRVIEFRKIQLLATLLPECAAQ